MGTNISRDDFRRMIEKDDFINSARGKTIDIELDPAPFISSPKQGLASYDYIVLGNLNLSDTHFRGKLHHIIFDKCNLVNATFSGQLSEVYFENSDLKGAKFHELDISPEQVYTSSNYEEAYFKNDKQLKHSIAKLKKEYQESSSEKKASNFIQNLAGDMEKVRHEFIEAIRPSISENESLPIAPNSSSQVNHKQKSSNPSR